MIRPCELSEVDEICALVNDAAAAYRGVIPEDCWKEPYMTAGELERDIADGVRFWGSYDADRPVAVMGLQPVGDVALVRHAYTRTANQGAGLGAALLARIRSETDRPMLVGTWKAATWAIRFYEARGFRLVTAPRKDDLLRRYWRVPARQMDESVVLADARWFADVGRT